MIVAEKVYTKAQIAKFTRAAKALAELGQEGCIMYLANDSLHLLSGESHEKAPGIGKERERLDRVVASVRIPGSGGGDW